MLRYGGSHGGRRTRKKAFIPWIVAAGAALLFVSVPASSATPGLTSDVKVDWNSFTVSPFGVGGSAAPVLTWRNLKSTVNAYAPDAVSVGDWTTPLTMIVGDAVASAESDLDASMLHTFGQDTDARGDTSGSIWSLRQGEFSVVGTGSVVFSVNYSWYATLYPPANANHWDSFAYWFVSLGAQTHNDPRGATNRGDSQVAKLEFLSPPDIGAFQGAGTLTINVPVVDGDYFYFAADASSTTNLYTSAVPTPPTLWLFVGGMATLMVRLAGRRRGRG